MIHWLSSVPPAAEPACPARFPNHVRLFLVSVVMLSVEQLYREDLCHLNTVAELPKVVHHLPWGLVDGVVLGIPLLLFSKVQNQMSERGYFFLISIRQDVIINTTP